MYRLDKMSGIEAICSGHELPDTIINPCQKLRSQKYKHVDGFQCTLLVQTLSFHKVTPGKLSVQTLHTGIRIYFILFKC